MENIDSDWDQFFDFGACEPAGTAAPGCEACSSSLISIPHENGIERDPAVPHQTYRGCEADTDHWQPIFGPGSIATDYVALADVNYPPPNVCVPIHVNFHLTATGQTLPDVDTELKLAATSNAEPSPTQATLSDLGDPVDEVHSSVLDSLEGCTCLGCVQERHAIDVQMDDRPFYGACCRIPPCTFSTCTWSPIGNHESLPPVLLPLSPFRSKELCSHEGTHFKHQGKYKCAETDCDHLAKQFRDLKRHYRAKHCTKTPEFPCDVLGCKYGGENGFHRKDKLTSHYKNMHQRGATSIAHRRNILPAPAKDEVPGPGIGQSSK